MDKPTIKLYKTRDFGAKINVTIEYIRYNFSPLIKVVLLIAIPIGLVNSIVFSNLFGTIFSFSGNPMMTEAESISRISSMGTNYLLLIALSLLTYSFMMSGVFIYMKMRDEMDETPDVLHVMRKAVGKVPGLILLMILVSIVSFIGLFLFIIPGIYLFIALSIAFPIYLFENEGVGTAFSKAFKLIRGKWWSTLGLLFITGMIAGVISYVFAIPLYATMFGQMFSTVSEADPDPGKIFEEFSNWYTTASMAFMTIGTYLTYLIPIIALSFQYFNLSERQEGTGIRNEIADFEKLD